MTGTQLAALIRYKTTTNSDTFTDAKMLPLVNIFKDEIASKIIGKDAGYFLIPATFDLVASSTSREYAFPNTMLNRMHKLEIKFVSTDARQPSRYIKDYQDSETESEIVQNFSNARGGFAHTIRRRAVFVLSGTIIAVTGGGRLWYHEYPADLADLTGLTELDIDPSTTTFGFPQQFHELLARRVSIEFKSARPKPPPLSRHELNYENDLTEALAGLIPVDSSGEIIANGLSTEETGDNGWNY